MLFLPPPPRPPTLPLRPPTRPALVPQASFCPSLSRYFFYGCGRLTSSWDTSCAMRLQTQDWALERNQGVTTLFLDIQGGCGPIAHLAQGPPRDVEPNREGGSQSWARRRDIIFLIQLWSLRIRARDQGCMRVLFYPLWTKGILQHRFRTPKSKKYQCCLLFARKCANFSGLCVLSCVCVCVCTFVCEYVCVTGPRFSENPGLPYSIRYSVFRNKRLWIFFSARVEHMWLTESQTQGDLQALLKLQTLSSLLWLRKEESGGSCWRQEIFLVKLPMSCVGRQISSLLLLNEIFCWIHPANVPFCIICR